MNSLKPTPQQTAKAARIIGKFTEPTPLKFASELSDQLEAKIYVKYEFQTPVHSFKIRGALNLVHHLTKTGDVSKIVTASTGNHGASMAYACQKYQLPLTVGVPVGADKSKIALIEEFGAEIDFIGRDLDETKELLLKKPLPHGTVFIEDGSSAEIVAGTATIGHEIIKELSDVELVFVPVGNGALVGGIATVIKEYNRAIKTIGIQSEQAPCMTLSFEAGHPINTEKCETFASGMAVRVAIPAAVDLMLDVVDQMELVTEQELKEAMGLFYRFTGHLLEGAGAAALSGAIKMQGSIRGKNVCLIASGANVDEGLKREIIEKFV